MIELEIRPLVGVGPILLGATRTDVHARLGAPEAMPADRREMFLGGLFVNYSEAGQVEFIEISRSKQYRATFHGVSLHEISAERAIEMVSAYDSFDSNDPELGHSYVFLHLQMSLWRGVLPEPDQPEGDGEGRRFEAVGIGVPGYYTSY